MTVSYTHLDVYKRQEVRCSCFQPRNALPQSQADGAGQNCLDDGSGDEGQDAGGDTHGDGAVGDDHEHSPTHPTRENPHS